MRYVFFISVLFLFIQVSYSQDPLKKYEPDSIGDYIDVEVSAKFKGGDINTFRDWVQKHMVYPPEAVQNGEFGRVTVQFVVDENGNVCKIKILRGVSKSLNKESVRVISESPRWTPAMIDGRNVRQKFVIPLIFSLS